jgi:hypothetical protein
MNAALLAGAVVAAFWALAKLTQGRWTDGSSSGGAIFAGSGGAETSGSAGAIFAGTQSGGGLAEMANVTKWAEQIKRFEGWKPGSVSYRNNNPGNLKYTGQAGATGKDARGFAIFSSEAAGMAALESDLRAKVKKYPGYSILQIMTRYLGGDVNNPQITGEGNPFAYAASIAKALNTSVNATLAEVFGGEINNTGVRNA